MLNKDKNRNGDCYVVIRAGNSKEIGKFVLNEATIFLEDPSQHLFSHWLSITVGAAFIFGPIFLWDCMKELLDPMFDHYFFVG